MIIKCNDKIINSDAIKIFELSDMSDIYASIKTEETGITADGKIIGCYETEKRAREVLEEIGYKILEHTELYHMPRK